jgi:hypothetical protein
VHRFGVGAGDRRVDAQVLGADRRRLCAPDRERGVASARSAARVRRGRKKQEQAEHEGANHGRAS